MKTSGGAREKTFLAISLHSGTIPFGARQNKQNPCLITQYMQQGTGHISFQQSFPINHSKLQLRLLAAYPEQKKVVRYRQVLLL